MMRLARAPALPAIAAVAVAAFVVGLGIRGASRDAREAVAAAGEARAFCARSVLELQVTILEARIESTGYAEHASRRIDDLELQLQDARLLAAFGYQPHGRARAVAMRVACDGGAYLPGSNGEAAWRALQATGLCEPAAPLPVPEASPAAGLLLQ
jgi:hypothetical protein